MIPPAPPPPPDYKVKPGERLHWERFSWVQRTYPKKSTKYEAWQWWKKERPSPELTCRMRDAILAQDAERQEKRARHGFAPDWLDLIRWLKRRRWEDEPMQRPLEMDRMQQVEEDQIRMRARFLKQCRDEGMEEAEARIESLKRWNEWRKGGDTR